MMKPKIRETVQWSWQLRVELLEVQPTIWRRILVPETITLPTLHRVLQASLGWTNSHLHQFNIAGIKYAAANPEWAEDLQQVDERRVTLHNALGMDCRCFDYLYDFGDGWHHIIVLEEQHAIDPKRSAAVQCIAGEKACPPEDVGGTQGYAEFRSAIADPKHEDHRRYLAWAGGRFDPDRFDLAESNRLLAKLKSPTVKV
jgi:hypothetical protein